MEATSASLLVKGCIIEKWRTDTLCDGYTLYIDGERTLEGSSEEFQFGCLLVGQSRQIVLKLGNHGKYDFSFRWILLVHKAGAEGRRITIRPIDG